MLLRLLTLFRTTKKYNYFVIQRFYYVLTFFTSEKTDSQMAVIFAWNCNKIVFVVNIKAFMSKQIVCACGCWQIRLCLRRCHSALFTIPLSTFPETKPHASLSSKCTCRCKHGDSPGTPAETSNTTVDKPQWVYGWRIFRSAKSKTWYLARSKF